MGITSVRCSVSGGQVTRVTDLEDEVTKLVCPEYEEPTGSCRLKRSARDGGPLSQLLERISEDTLVSRSTRCALGPNVS
jgi:hypothetical protein